MVLRVRICIGFSSAEGVDVREAEVAGAVGAEYLLFLTLDDRKRGVDVAHVIAVGDAVEVEEESIQLGPET